ncbi:MAG: efflux RND transporter periplasmic adaptor subunit [Thermodesulfobacteriales bacterium]|nr:MAG: efflux RND transporter periplasmic adaptor subunit [Thermodesulfobacteriales bacterium]
MKKRSLQLIILISIFWTGVALISCSSEGEITKPEDEHTDEHSETQDHIKLSQEALTTLNLKTSVVERKPLSSEIKTTAVIEPNRTRIAHVSPRISGRVVDVKAFLGDSVQQGQVLAELDSIELGQTKAEYLESKANLEVARANYSRENRLFKKQITSEKEYLYAKAEFIRSESALNTALETLRLLGLSDEEIKSLKWGETDHPASIFPLIAPFTGTVVEQHIVLGEFIKPEDKPYTIADLSHLWIQLDIYEKDLRWVEVGKTVDIKVNAYPDENFEGKITYVSDILDESTRATKARVEILNMDGKLKPGMFATAIISIPSSDNEEVIVVPGTAIQQIEGKSAVFVQEGEDSFEMRGVSLGQHSGDYVQVLKGLSPGDVVVTEGGFYLKSALLKEELGEGHAH